jgi:predicted ATP-binding protein involved in virulence
MAHSKSDGKKSNLQGLSDYTKTIQSKISENNENVNIPIFAYYPVNRAVLDIPLRIRAKHDFKLIEAYEGALTGAANFRTFFEWFRAREDLENESIMIRDKALKLTLDISQDEELISKVLKHFQNITEKDIPINPENSSTELDTIRTELNDFQFPDPQLEVVRRALKEFLPEFSNITVRRKPLRMEINKNGKRLIVNQLSDGEKSLIALIGDLARRLSIANPVASNPLEGSGIILIDEIDLHLHPKWQRLVIPKLLEIFPNCQFIVSTHSPSVITHVKPDYYLFLLRQTDSNVVAERDESYGKTVDRVLEDLMGLKTTRPDEINSKLATLFKKIDEGDLKEARKIISMLRGEIGADPELGKADVLVKRKELIGK